jgi:hypothetical protein
MLWLGINTKYKNMINKDVYNPHTAQQHRTTDKEPSMTQINKAQGKVRRGDYFNNM